MGFDPIQLGRELERVGVRMAELEVENAELRARLDGHETSHAELASAAAEHAEAAAAHAEAAAAEAEAAAAESEDVAEEDIAEEAIVAEPEPEREPEREPEHRESRPARTHFLHRKLWGNAS